MELKDLIIAVKEKQLSKEQIEAYRDQLSSLFAQMMMEMADLEKEEALFPQLDGQKANARKILWNKTPSGQRLIVLKRYCIATKEILSSLKSRLYNLYN